uniref:Uncharacterized protein n=1 Tax=Kalanchoe fedtschenkoi TaxID=63787 RepID=A0A7N0VDB5_KALFE
MGDCDYDYDYRSKSTAFDRRDMQIQPYTGPHHQHPPARSYSTSSSSSYAQPPRDFSLEMTKGKPASSSAKNWGFGDPEFQRKKRVASYKVYAVEGRVKGSFRHSFRWLKDKYTKVVYGWW